MGYNNNMVLDDEMDLDVITNLVEKKRHYDAKVMEYQNSRNQAASELTL